MLANVEADGGVGETVDPILDVSWVTFFREQRESFNNYLMTKTKNFFPLLQLVGSGNQNHSRKQLAIQCRIQGDRRSWANIVGSPPIASNITIRPTRVPIMPNAGTVDPMDCKMFTGTMLRSNVRSLMF